MGTSNIRQVKVSITDQCFHQWELLGHHAENQIDKNGKKWKRLLFKCIICENLDPVIEYEKED